jgi:predicted phage terminase large subunit-like protein
LNKIEKRVGSYFFGALYQQRPAPLEGGLFKRHWFIVIHALPAGCTLVRYWDKAATPGGGDWSVGVLMARSPRQRYIVVDVVRGQWSPGERKRIERQTAEMDRARYGHVATRGEQEPGSSGVESAQASVENLAGFDARFERVTGDKLTRSMPFAAQCEVGNVDMLAGTWNAAYLDELTIFPNGKYDDQVDGSSGAFAQLALPDTPAVFIQATAKGW